MATRVTIVLTVLTARGVPTPVPPRPRAQRVFTGLYTSRAAGLAGFQVMVDRQRARPRAESATRSGKFSLRNQTKVYVRLLYAARAPPSGRLRYRRVR